MDEHKIQKGIKITPFELAILRNFIEDNIRSYIGLRRKSGGDGIVMKTDTDTDFKVTIDGAGNWTIAEGFIINHQNEIVHNIIAGLSPASGEEPGGLTGDNPLDDAVGTVQYIIVQTEDKIQEVDHGEISVTLGSNVVVGTDTRFTKWLESGSKFKISSGANAGEYIVDEVTTDTALTTVSNFAANESGIKFSILSEFFEGYPPGGNENAYLYNSFTFRTTIDDPPSLADGEYVLAKCTYNGSWSAEDKRSDNIYTLPLIRLSETGLSSSVAEIDDAVGKKHTQGTDTGLGTMAADINMNTHKLIGLSVPSSNGHSIRQTTKITEANLESVIDLNQVEQTKAFYVGKYGDDANDGKRIDEAKLTIQAAVTAASSGDTVFVVTPDDFVENITLKNGVDIIAFNPKATVIKGSVTDNSVECHCYLKINIEASSSPGLYVNHSNSIVIFEGDVSVSSGNAAHVDHGTLIIQNGDVTSISGTVVYVVSAGSFTMRNGTINSIANSQYAHGILTTSDNIILKNVKILCTHVDAKAINATSAYNVRCMGVWANRDDHANITQLITGGFNFDADVQ